MQFFTFVPQSLTTSEEIQNPNRQSSEIDEREIERQRLVKVAQELGYDCSKDLQNPPSIDTQTNLLSWLHK